MSEHASDGVARLIAETDCRRLILTAASLVDNAKYSEFADLFTPGGTVRRPGGQDLAGREQIIASYTSRSSDRLTRHLILGSIFTQISQETASAVTDVMVWSGNLADEVGPLGRAARSQAVGRFMDDFVRTATGWKINRRNASFDFFAA